MAKFGLQRDFSAARDAAEGRTTGNSYRGFNRNNGAGKPRNPGYGTGLGGATGKYEDGYNDFALAPYNFIPYDRDKIVPAVARTGEVYSGVIHCSLETKSPLLVAGPSEKEDGKNSNDSRNNDKKPREFLSVNGKIVIPGTSLKGMLRNYVEIISCSALRPLSDERIFWRDVASGDDSSYKDYFGGNDAKAEGGFLVRKGASYTLYPAEITRNKTIEVPKGQDKECLQQALKYDSDNYYTGIMSNPKKKGERALGDNKKLIRGYKFVKKEGAEPEEVSLSVFNDFISQMTDDQRTRWEVEEKNLSTTGARVFCIKDQKTKEITAIGTARYFRIPYDRSPAQLAGVSESAPADFAEGLFGLTRNESQRGRVQVSFARFSKISSDKTRNYALSQPHASAVRHYLEQDTSKKKAHFEFKELMNYNDPSARVRGHKYYWHRDPESDSQFANKNIESKLRPIGVASQASFDITVDRISQEELGALLTALELPQGHCHKLGTGKAMGLGSVRIKVDCVNVQECSALYRSLKERLSDGQSAAAMDKTVQEQCKNAFAAYIAKYVDPVKYKQKLAALDRMTDFEHRPANDKTRNMQLQKRVEGKDNLPPTFAGSKAVLAHPSEV